MVSRLRYNRSDAMRDLSDIRRRIEEDIARPVLRTILERIPEEMKELSPAVDVFEKGENIVVKVELPGVRQEDIDISVVDDVLTIKGEKKEEPGVKDADYYRTELNYGNFFRTINLPATVDTQSIDAVYDDGIVRIALPIAHGSKPKKVPIKVKGTTEK